MLDEVYLTLIVIEISFYAKKKKKKKKSLSNWEFKIILLRSIG